jgi:hypothetical protein
LHCLQGLQQLLALQLQSCCQQAPAQQLLLLWWCQLRPAHRSLLYCLWQLHCCCCQLQLLLVLLLVMQQVKGMARVMDWG